MFFFSGLQRYEIIYNNSQLFSTFLSKSLADELKLALRPQPLPHLRVGREPHAYLHALGRHVFRLSLRLAAHAEAELTQRLNTEKEFQFVTKPTADGEQDADDEETDDRPSTPPDSSGY